MFSRWIDFPEGQLEISRGRFFFFSHVGQVFNMGVKSKGSAGSTISTLLHDRINPKDCQVLSLGDF